MQIEKRQSFGPDDFIRSHQLLSRLDRIGHDTITHLIEHYFLSPGITPNPLSIELETYNRCNNDCAFCPVNRNNDTRKAHYMDEKLFYSIIDQLRIMDYSGSICLYSNNEPLLDKRIFKFVEYAKKIYRMQDTRYIQTEFYLIRKNFYYLQNI